MKGQLNIIGDAVRKYRRAKKWTQHDLAGACQRLGWQLIRETLINWGHGESSTPKSCFWPGPWGALPPICWATMWMTP